MKCNKTIIATAVATLLSASVTTTVHASHTVSMDFAGLFTFRDGSGKKIANSSNPYYSDPTWGYGERTPISGTMTFNTVTGEGAGTIAPFDFFNGGWAVFSDIQYQAVGGGLVIGSMTFSWSGSDVTTSVVLDATGLFSALASGQPPISATLDSKACTDLGLNCATAATDGIKKGNYAMGPIPVATTTLNVNGDTGFGTTLDQLRDAWAGGFDDGIGGSPMTNGPFSGANANFDFTTIHINNVVPDVPVPAAAWLFGSGLIGLIGVARRRKRF